MMGGLGVFISLIYISAQTSGFTHIFGISRFHRDFSFSIISKIVFTVITFTYHIYTQYIPSTPFCIIRENEIILLFPILGQM